MKILLVIESAGGGSGRHVVDLAAGLLERGHEVCLAYSPLRAEAWFEREARALPLRALERLPMRRAVGPWDIGAARELRRLIDRLGPFDVIHGHSSKAGALARLVAPKGAARVYTPHALRTMDPTTGALARQVYGGVEALLGTLFCDALIAVAPEEAAHARALGVPADKVHVVVNGLTPAPPVDREAARAALGLAPDDIAVGFVGRLCDQKDPVRFAGAVRLARSRDPRVRGVVLGDGPLKAETAAAGGEALTIHPGLNARAYMPALDVFAMTSRYEAMPYVLLEAVQAGLPIVSTRVGGTSVTVRDGENGTLLPVDAPAEAIADAMLALCDPGLRRRMGQGSRARGLGIGAREMIEATEGVYRSSQDWK